MLTPPFPFLLYDLISTLAVLLVLTSELNNWSAGMTAPAATPPFWAMLNWLATIVTSPAENTLPSMVIGALPCQPIASIRFTPLYLPSVTTKLPALTPSFNIFIPGAVGVYTDKAPTFITPSAPTTIPFGDINTACPFVNAPEPSTV